MTIALSAPSRASVPPCKPARCRRAVPGILLCSLVLFIAEAQISAGEPAEHEFDPPFFVPGSVHGQLDWIVDRGEALVVPGMGLGGSGALAVMESAQSTQVRLPAGISFAAADRPYYADAWVRLRACPWMVFDESIDFSSARIGLFRTGLTSGDAEWHFFSGDGSGGGYWVNTGVAARVEPFTDLMEGWARLTVGIRPAEGCWDLWVDGQLIGASAGLQFPAGPGSGHFVLLGDASRPFFADDISLGALHPLGFDGNGDGIPDPRPGAAVPPGEVIPDALAADRDADGIPDLWETAHSLDPDAAADAALDPDGDGFTNLDEYLMGTDPSAHTATARLANDGAAVFNRFSASTPRRADTPR